MLKQATVGLFCLLLMSSPSFAGSDYPTMGILYNTVESNWLVYDCNKPDNGKLDCKFQQTSVRNKADPSDLEGKLAEARKSFPGALKELNSEKGLCSFLAITLDVLTGEKTPEEAAESAPKGAISNKDEFVSGMRAIPAARKQDMSEDMLLINRFCTEKSQDSYTEMTRAQHKKDMETCIIAGGNSFTHTFSKVDDFDGTSAWVVESKPDGPCGIVRLDRFVRDENKVGGIPFWTYYAKKAVTNKKGTFLGDFKCSQMDENEYFYDWRQSAAEEKGIYKKDCKYIEFSPM